MKLFVTGGAGFIGSNYVRYVLANTDDEVTVYDALTYAGNLDDLRDVDDDPRYAFVKGDICDREDARGRDGRPRRGRALRGREPRRPLDRRARRVRAAPTASAPTWCATSPGGSGSSASCTSPPTRCTARSRRARRSETDPLEPRSPYSASKAGSDLIALSYHATYGLPVIVTRWSNNFGPYQFPEKVIPLFVTNLLDGRKVPLYGDGLNVRDWFYVDDNCAGVDLVLRRGRRRRDLQHRRRQRDPQPGADRQAAGAARRGRGDDRVRRPTASATTGATRSTSTRSRALGWRQAAHARRGAGRDRGLVPGQRVVVGAAQGAGGAGLTCGCWSPGRAASSAATSHAALRGRGRRGHRRHPRRRSTSATATPSTRRSRRCGPTRSCTRGAWTAVDACETDPDTRLPGQRARAPGTWPTPPPGRGPPRATCRPTTCSTAPRTSPTSSGTGPTRSRCTAGPSWAASTRSRPTPRARRSCARRGCAASTATTWSRPSCGWPTGPSWRSSTTSGATRRFTADLAVGIRRLAVGPAARACSTSPTRATVSWYEFVRAVLESRGPRPGQGPPHHHRRARPAPARAPAGQLGARQRRPAAGGRAAAAALPREPRPARRPAA